MTNHSDRQATGIVARIAIHKFVLKCKCEESCQLNDSSPKSLTSAVFATSQERVKFSSEL